MDIDPAINTPREPVSRKFYLAYLNSAGWRVTRNHALRRAGYRCSRCSARRNLQVHHKCYDRLGREWDQDLEVLCEDCHEEHHDVERARDGSSLKLYLKLAAQVLHRKTTTTFSDLAEALKVECAKLKIPYDGERVGNAIALVTGKKRGSARLINPTALLQSCEPINKAEALRLMFELSQREDRPVIHTMPPAKGKNPGAIDIYGPVPRENWGDQDEY